MDKSAALVTNLLVQLRLLRTFNNQLSKSHRSDFLKRGHVLDYAVGPYQGKGTSLFSTLIPPMALQDTPD